MSLFVYPQSLPKFNFVACAIGNFDGVHRGHQKLISDLVAEAKKHPDGKTVVVTFEPHPAEVLGKTDHPLLPLTPLREKVRLLNSYGIDFVYLIRFTKSVSRLSYQEFVEHILFQRLGVQLLVVGPDARIGRGGEGSVNPLRKLFEQTGKRLTVLPFETQPSATGQLRVSSRLIRELVFKGELNQAAKLMGRNLSLTAHVVHGNKRGRQLGFPTANQRPRKILLPPFGVYVTRVVLEGVSYLATTNVGIRPTFTETDVVVESYLLDYHGADFYGKLITVEFIEKIRDELKFEAIPDLIDKIKQDNAYARSQYQKK